MEAPVIARAHYGDTARCVPPGWRYLGRVSTGDVWHTVTPAVFVRLEGTLDGVAVYLPAAAYELFQAVLYKDDDIVARGRGNLDVLTALLTRWSVTALDLARKANALEPLIAAVTAADDPHPHQLPARHALPPGVVGPVRARPLPGRSG